ncbi:DUF6221 family protein [Streptomyces sp. NPDC018019]|uniref:DUF6221 family protein n=1 Tax=Streptomyces sp. NPDC018019 TaxID=3365030 RepID=UPI0037985221
MSADLVEFIRARLGEDGEAARATTERQPYTEWDAVGAGDDSDSRLSHWEVVKIACPHPTPAAKAIAVHIARHDPARVLAEVEAKREIVDDLAAVAGGDYIDAGEPVLAERVLRLLALPYGGHADFNERWRS